MFTFILYHIIYRLSIDLRCSVDTISLYFWHEYNAPSEASPVISCLQLQDQVFRVQPFAKFSYGEIFFLSSIIITKNPTRGRVNVTLIEVAWDFLVEKDDSSLVEYKVFFLYRIYEVLVNDKQLLYLVSYILVLTRL